MTVPALFCFSFSSLFTSFSAFVFYQSLWVFKAQNVLVSPSVIYIYIQYMSVWKWYSLHGANRSNYAMTAYLQCVKCQHQRFTYSLKHQLRKKGGDYVSGFCHQMTFFFLLLDFLRKGNAILFPFLSLNAMSDWWLWFDFWSKILIVTFEVLFEEYRQCLLSWLRFELMVRELSWKLFFC